MEPNQWAALAVAAVSLVGSLAMVVRHLVKHYLSELRPNSGTSIKDQISRLENRVDQIMILLIESNKPKKRKVKNEETPVTNNLA
jgi:hypothetical protein